MILDFFGNHMDGDSWEELCQSCYKIRYQNEHYTEIPAAYGGDAGIEGFTRTGIVIQCYYPEKCHDDNNLYEHQRNKMTKDIGKMLDADYKKRLQKLGVLQIKEWHFVIPEYKDSRIIEHAETKRKEVLAKKREDPEQYDYIAEDFIVVIKTADDFKFEITRVIRNSVTETKLNLAVLDTRDVDWTKCDSEKVNNIKRKVKAVMNDVSMEDEDYRDVIDTYIESYLKGIEIMRMLRVSYSEIYEDVYNLEQAYKKQVSLRTKMNTDRSLNMKIFNEILLDFEKQLRENCQYFTVASILELKTDIISAWLADCSMQFRK